MPSVLIVDDEEAIRRLIRSTLEQAGYHVREAADGKAGLSHYRQSPADLVIMDILMPDQDGLESILTLRREFPEARIMAKRHDQHLKLPRCGPYAGRAPHAPETLRDAAAPGCGSSRDRRLTDASLI